MQIFSYVCSVFVFGSYWILVIAVKVYIHAKTKYKGTSKYVHKTNKKLIVQSQSHVVHYPRRQVCSIDCPHSICCRCQLSCSFAVIANRCTHKEKTLTAFTLQVPLL